METLKRNFHKKSKQNEKISLKIYAKQIILLKKTLPLF